MHATSSTNPARRTKAQWQSLVHEWQQSEQSATQFCKSQNIGYASFCQWRKRLSKSIDIQPETDKPDFIDLSALDSRTQPSHWDIVLNLGDGIELKLSRR